MRDEEVRQGDEALDGCRRIDHRRHPDFEPFREQLQTALRDEKLSEIFEGGGVRQVGGDRVRELEIFRDRQRLRFTRHRDLQRGVEKRRTRQAGRDRAGCEARPRSAAVEPRGMELFNTVLNGRGTGSFSSGASALNTGLEGIANEGTERPTASSVPPWGSAPSPSRARPKETWRRRVKYSRPTSALPAAAWPFGKSARGWKNITPPPAPRFKKSRSTPF